MPFQVYELHAVIVVVFVELGVIVKFKDSVTQFVVVPEYTPDAV